MEIIETKNVPIKAWIDGVGVEDQARKQLINTASLPIVFHHVAVMPDVHFGMGATVGSVVPTEGAIIPAAVGVDIGCFTGDTLVPLLAGTTRSNRFAGGRAARLARAAAAWSRCRPNLPATQLPDSLKDLRFAIEKAVPHGRTRERRQGRSRRVAQAAGDDRARVEATLLRDYETILDEASEDPRRQRRQSPRHARHRQSLHRGLSRRDRSRVVHAALGLARRRQSDRHVLHRAREARHEASRREPARSRPRVSARGHARTSTTTSTRSSWAQRYAMTNRTLMMDAVIAAATQAVAAVRARRARGELPPQLRAEGASLRSRRVRDAQGCGARRRRRPRHHSGLDGRAQLHRARQGQPGVVLLVQPRRGTRDVARRGEAAVHRRGSREGDRGHRVPQG